MNEISEQILEENETPSQDPKTEPEEVSTLPSDVEVEEIPIEEPEGEPVEESEVAEEGENPTAPVPMEHEGVNTSELWRQPEADYKVTIVGKTPGGKEVQVKRRDVGNGYTVEFRGGNAPSTFDGWFTSYDRAEKQARLYLNKKWEEHGQTVSTEAAA